jgi:hypothetical protein
MNRDSTTRSVKLVMTILGLLLAVGATSTAEAQTFELTPFAGWRSGGSFEDVATGTDIDLDDGLGYGLIVGIPWNAQYRSRLELVWSWQSSAVGAPGTGDPWFDLDVHYLHLSGMVPFATSNNRLDVLLSIGAGATYMVPDIDGAGSEVRFSASAALGLLYHVSDRVGIRLEARGWFTFTDAGGSIFCSGGCAIAFSGSGFVQGELTAGLQIAF